MPKYCPNCGMEISERVKYCPSCGVKIEIFPLNKDKKSTIGGTSGSEDGTPNRDNSSLPLSECFFCGVKTSKIFYCPLCGHDFCENHKLHQDHLSGFQENSKQPESTIPLKSGRRSNGFKKSHIGIALFVLVVVLLLGFFLQNLNLSDVGSEPIIPPQSTTVINYNVIVQNETITPLLTVQTVPTIPTYLITTPSPEITPVKISDEALKAKIRYAENRLEALADSDIADVHVYMPDSKITINSVQRSVHCGEVKESKELGYVIDVNNGDMFFVKGWYGYIQLTAFTQYMTKGHTYVLIHDHPNNWKTTCTDTENGYTMETVSTQSTFSVDDLEVAGELAQVGYNIKSMIVDNCLSENSYIYETYPKKMGDWKSKPEIKAAISRIESRMGTSFENTMENYNVESLMPLLTKELNYTYIVQGTVIS